MQTNMFGTNYNEVKMFNIEFWQEWWNFFQKIIAPSTFVTLKIVFFTILIGGCLGFILSIMLILFSPRGLNPKKHLYKILDFIVNTIRAFPILILIVALSPITRRIVGTTVGEKAVIFPLAIAATSFMARAFEGTFSSVNPQLIEAARSFGASNMQIIIKVIVKESRAGIISVLTMATISYISSSTIAGAVGGGGIGAIALNYGYQSFNDSVLYTSIIILFIMVQITQELGNYLYKKICDKTI